MSVIQSDPLPAYPFDMVAPEGYQTTDKKVTVNNSDEYNNYSIQGYTVDQTGGSRRRHRRSLSKSSRKYKKSKRVFRKKSRSTRRR
jgi:hypothetical protein